MGSIGKDAKKLIKWGTYSKAGGGFAVREYGNFWRKHHNEKYNDYKNIITAIFKINDYVIWFADHLFPIFIHKKSVMFLHSDIFWNWISSFPRQCMPACERYILNV